MKTYTFAGRTYGSLWELRRAAPQFVLPKEPDNALLLALGISVTETPAPCPEASIRSELARIDIETANAISAGFDYEIDGETLHFAYDGLDQQNFADTANACLLSKSGTAGLPETVTWNAYKADGSLVRLELTASRFLALYAGGALAHKARCMEEGGQKKAALQVA